MKQSDLNRTDPNWLISNHPNTANQLKPSDRINKVAHLLPAEVLDDIRTRLGDWVLSGGKSDDAYAAQQARYAENVAAAILSGTFYR